MQYVRANRVSLKSHPVYNERWLQQTIADDPAVLGLGDVIVREVERIHRGPGGAGREPGTYTRQYDLGQEVALEARERTEEWQRFAARFGEIEENVEKVVQGKHYEIRLALVTLVAEGHALIEDVPGVGKTMLAKAIARLTLPTTEAEPTRSPNISNA